MTQIAVLFVILVAIVSSSNALTIRRELTDSNEVIVQAPIGTFKGSISHATELGLSARSFTGIRYAQPPVGNLRWKAAVPAPKFNGIYNATIETPGCPQKCELPPHTCPKTQSEDCLFMDLYTPRLQGNNPSWPVYVFLPGGHFEVCFKNYFREFTNELIARRFVLLFFNVSHNKQLLM